MKIHRAIQSGRMPNASGLARDLEVSTKSIHRDLEFMRDRLDLPVEWDARRNGYFYSSEVTAFPTLQITEGELVALLIAEKALQQYRGTSFEKPLISALQKLEGSLPDAISLNLSDWDQAISFRTSAEPILNLEILDRLARAANGRRCLRLQYRKPGASTPEARLVDPYHLANINGEWFLFAWCHLRKDIRTFVPARILSLEETGGSFQRPKGFSLDQRLRDSFGVHSSEGSYRVVVRFTPLVADFIREKKWHPSQELVELEDGGIELTLQLSSLVEVQRWLLGWGGEVRVLQPPELVRRIREAAKILLEQHEEVPT